MHRIQTISAVIFLLSPGIVSAAQNTRHDATGGTVVVIEDFEAPHRWHTWAGDSPPLPTGGVRFVSTNPHGGRQCGAFTFDVSCNHGYVSSDLNLRFPPKVRELRFWVRCDGEVAFTVRLVGADDQTHQISLPQKPGPWRQVRLPVTRPWPHHYGGKNDGVFRQPFISLKFLREHGSRPAKGAIWIDDVEVVTSASLEELRPLVTFPRFDFSAGGLRLTGRPGSTWMNQTLHFTVINPGKEERTAVLELSGPSDWPAHHGRFRIAAGGSASTRFTIDYRNWNPYNRYPLTCRLSSAGQTASQTREVRGRKSDGVWLGQPRDSRTIRSSRIGANAHFAQGWDPDAYVPLLARCGIKWVREDGIRFVHYRQDPKTFDVDPRFDLSPRGKHYLDLLRRYGIRLNLIIWGSGVEGDRWNPAAFRIMCRAIARLLAPYGVEQFEIENEPHGSWSKKLGGSWNGKPPSPWVAKYVEFVNAGARGLKEGNPKARVIAAGGLITTCHRMLDAGVAREVDGLTDHPYSYSTVPELIPFGGPVCLERDGIRCADDQHTFVSSMRMLKEKMSAAGRPDMEIWLTEWGFTTYRKAPGKPRSMYDGYTLTAQAKYIARRLIESLALPEVNATFIYDFRCDRADPGDPEANFGLVGNDYLRLRPSYFAVQRICGLFSDGVKPCTPPLEISVPLDRSRGRKGGGWTRPWRAAPVMWEGRIALEPPTQPRAYAFRTPRNELLLALWMPGYADAELQPDRCDVTVRVTGYAHPVAIDVLTGERRDLAWEEAPDKGVTVLKDLAVPDYPVVIKLFPAGKE